jgi:hypothetical protein
MADGTAIDNRWYATTALAGVAGMPTTSRNVNARAQREGWTSRLRAAQGGGREYAFSSLPATTQAALLMRERGSLQALGMQGAVEQLVQARHTPDALASARQALENASQKRKDEATERLHAVLAVEALCGTGAAMMQARALVAAQLQQRQVKGASVASLARWQAMVDGAPRADWLALLLPAYVGRTAEAACDPQAWEWYKSYWLTRRQPTYAETYRRLHEIAADKGWAIPTGKTLQRRIEREIDPHVATLLREGPEAAAHRTPVQQRDRSVFGAGEAVNGDGLKFDKLWVKFEDGEILNTATAWFWQDLRTNRVLAWRLGKTENTDLFRLATYDLTGVCAPAHVWIDNTTVAANKEMTAGAKGRHRHKAKAADGLGLLLMLGMDPHFTNPDKEAGNPGAKPVERAFGIGGLHSEVANNPQLINRGYNKATAIPVEELRAVVAFEVARFNARTERRTAECRGVLSFDQAWENAAAERPPRVLADSQRRMLLMSRESVRVDRDHGTVWLKAGRSQYDKNRYWCESLARHAGHELVAHFDPENLSAGIHLYSLDGRYLFPADHLPGRAYNDRAAGREDNKLRQRLIKLNKKAAAETQRLSQHERDKLYRESTQQPVPPKRQRNGNVVTAHFQKPANPARDAQRATGTDGGLTALDKAALAYMDRMRKDSF